jgi:DNA repair protein RadC
MAHRHHRVRNLGKEEKPRERLKKFGPEALADDELLAVVLARGTKGEKPLPIARRVLDSRGFGALLGEGAMKHLCQLCDVGEGHACQILACFELGRRFFQRAAGINLHTPEAVYEHLRSMRRLHKEAFRGLYLDVKGRLVHDEIVSLGILTMNLVHPREVFRPAIEHSAASVILVHNHPSGDPSPSAEDLRVTRQLVEVGKLVDIEVLDHVIIGREGFVSLRRQGLMGPQVSQ